MTDEELDAIRTRHAATTPGEWHRFKEGAGMVHDERGRTIAFSSMDERMTDNAEWIAHVHQDIPALLDHIAFLRGLVHDLQLDSSAYRRGVQDEQERCGELTRSVLEQLEEEQHSQEAVSHFAYALGRLAGAIALREPENTSRAAETLKEVEG